MTTLNATVAEAIDQFVAFMNEHPDKPEGYTFSKDAPGQKVVRIVMETARFNGHPGQRSVHCFIDKTDGTLLKADGWKRPAPGPRGNIVTDLEGVKARWTWAGGYLYAR